MIESYLLLDGSIIIPKRLEFHEFIEKVDKIVLYTNKLEICDHTTENTKLSPFLVDPLLELQLMLDLYLEPTTLPSVEFNVIKYAFGLSSRKNKLYILELSLLSMISDK